MRTRVRMLLPVKATPLRSEQLLTPAPASTWNVTAVHSALLLQACRQLPTLGFWTSTRISVPTPLALLSRHQEYNPKPLSFTPTAERRAACCCPDLRCCSGCCPLSTLNAMRALHTAM